MSHKNRNWQRRWTIAADGTYQHQTGLAVRFDAGGRASVDPATQPAAEEAIIEADGTDRHVGAEIYRLVTEAQRLYNNRTGH